MINYQRIYFKFSQMIKQMLFYISCKICNHSLISIDFIAPVYELFDNPSYIFFLQNCSTIRVFIVKMRSESRGELPVQYLMTYLNSYYICILAH
mgnify:CR=1 FL=1